MSLNDTYCVIFKPGRTLVLPKESLKINNQLLSGERGGAAKASEDWCPGNDVQLAK